MDWNGFVIPFNMNDIIAGVTRTFMSFSILIWFVLGVSLALFALNGIYNVFVKKEGFFPWNR